MKQLTTIGALAAALLAATCPTRGAIESNFDDQVYPGTAGNGWVAGWTNNIGTPAFLTSDPIDGTTPYIRLDATGAATRNLMRQFESGGGVNPAAPYFVRWKFRLNDADFDSAFSVFNDRVHFFGRNAPRVTASTDASINWSIMAAGAANAGAVGGRTFWVFDNADGTGAFNVANHVDTAIPLVPQHTYTFEVLVDPLQLNYAVSIVDETTSASFTSAARHRFRNLTASGDTHTNLHFGVQASAATEPRAFDLDSVSIRPWGGPVIGDVVPAAYAIHPPGEGIRFTVSALDPVPPAGIGLRLNGANVSAQLNITGPDTNRLITYTSLAANQVYEMIITATNTSSAASLTRTFHTATNAFTLYDSEGFTSEVLYPLGPLQSVTHGNAIWEALPSESSEIVSIGEPQGKVLERLNMGATRADFLHFPPVSSGTIIVEFDAWVSITSGRTFDISLLPVGSSTTTMASLVGWGVVAARLAYYDDANWQSVADLEPNWHHCKIIHYLSGAAAGRYDILVNGTAVAEKILWRNAVPGTPLSRVRYQSDITGPVLQSGRIDNLVVTAGPEDPNAFPPPALTNVSPAQYTVVRPTAGLHFEVTSVLPISASDIAVVLNGSNVSSGLAVTGSANHLSVSYGPLGAGQHSVEISATNGAGPVTLTQTFYATEDPLTIFDSGGFSDDVLYPVGMLQAVTNNGSRWVPAAAPNSGEIGDLADGQYGKVLRRTQLGASYNDYLLFPPVSSGIVGIELDARVSSVEGRTLDLSLNAVTANGGGTQGPFIMWSTNALYYYNGTAWVPQTAMDTGWHRVKLTCYVSGVWAGTFDLEVDGAPVGKGLVWRTVFSPVGTLRIGSLNTGAVVAGYGEVDNLILKVAPEPLVALPVTLLNPVHSGSTFSLTFQSLSGITYLAQYNGELGTTNWTTLETMPGDGTLKTVTHTNPPAGPLFYRIKSEVP